MIHSRVAWMFLPVDRSITVSDPHLMLQRIFSTSSSIEDRTAELPMLALIFTRKLRPMIIGSDSGGLFRKIADGPFVKGALPGFRGRLRIHAGRDARAPTALHRAAQVFADGDELHLGGDDALLCVMHLGHASTLFRPQRRAAEDRKIL